jgi:hypothetical protein
MQSWPPEHEDSTHTLYSVTHLLCRHITTPIKLYISVIVRDLEPGPGCLPPLISTKRGRVKTILIRK